MQPRKSLLLPVLVGLVAVCLILLIALIIIVGSPWRSGAEQPEPSATPVARQAATPEDPGSPTPFPLDALNLQDPKGESNLYIEYILDASGSMLDPLSDGVPKRDAAKEYLIEHLLTFAPETHFGLRAYGHRLKWQDDSEASCEDIELIAPVEVGQFTQIAAWLQDFETRGMTPLHASVELALQDFDTSDPLRLNNVILISDGIETCAGDPCGLVEMAKREGVHFTLHVVGLAVDGETRAQLSCMAEQGGGVYYDVFSSEELQAALEGIAEDVKRDEVIVPHEEEARGTTSASTPVPNSNEEAASIYCTGLGYTEEVREGAAGEYRVCIFPDGSECDSWEFLTGKCGQEYSHDAPLRQQK